MNPEIKKGDEQMPQICLEAVRVNARCNQKEWAEKLGVSNKTVVNWEKGNTEH